MQPSLARNLARGGVASNGREAIFMGRGKGGGEQGSLHALWQVVTANEQGGEATLPSFLPLRL